VFSYYTVYKMDSKTLPFGVFKGAAQLDSKKWIFFTNEDGGHATTQISFEQLSKRGRSIEGRTSAGDKMVFTPTTLAEVKANPDVYGASAEEAAAMQTDSDLYVFLIASEIPEWYVERYGPPEEQTELEEDVSLALNALEEEKGVPAKPGEVHRWSDGNEYQKQFDGSWRRTDTDWSESHPSVPKSTKTKYWNETDGWDPQRKATHARVLKEVADAAFGGKTPVSGGDNPEFTYIMGPPAAGKTTRQRQPEYDNTVKLDPDEFVERLPEFITAQKVKARNGAQSVVEEALMLNDKLIEDAKDGRFNFIISGSGANLQWMEKELFPDLKRRGYRINIVMTYVEDLDELLLRTEARGHVRGRFVPSSRTRQLHAMLPKNFKELTKNPDVTSIALLNSHQTESERDPKNAFVYQQVGDQKSVLDADFFDSFMEKTT
jgi:hypothetical protein